MLSHFLGRARRAGESRKLVNRNARRFRPHLDLLEDRTLLSTTLVGNTALPVVTPAAHLLTASPAPDTTSASPAAGTLLPGGFSPQQISQAYGFNQITFNNGTIQGDGTGQTIAIIDAYDEPTAASDLATFDSTFGLPAPPSFTKVNQNGGTSYPSTAPTSWSLEESLDVEWAHAMAPGASILLVETNSNSWSDLMAGVNYARSQPGVAAVSMSFYGGEWSGEKSYDSYFTTPSGHSGVTFVACSGDNGTGANEPGFPSVSPNVLAVGGTQLTTDGSGNYQSETGWSGSGGGISAFESQPAYQKGVVTQSNSQRTVPDVSYNASSNSPYAVYNTTAYGGWIQVYGTSAGAPQLAALVAIADQGRALAGLSALDGASQTLPALYQLPAGDWHDITTGSNGLYSAGPGYDLVTGIGTPIANLVVGGLVNYGGNNGTAPTITSPASATPNPVTGTTTNLSVQAQENGSSQGLTFTWSVTAEPTGAQNPTYSVNGNNAAQNTTATFYKAGAYTFLVTVADSSGHTATSSVNVTVNQTWTGVGVSPTPTSVPDGGNKQFAASELDQFGQAMSSQPSGWTWSLAAGSGTVGTGGMYTAPSSGNGSASVQAAASGMSGDASVTYGSVPAAPSNLTATAPAPRQVNLSWTNNASNQTGFVIQRSFNGGNWTQIATVGANVTTYTDKTVSKRKTYSYRVYAYNSYGNSGYSNTATVTTPGAGVVGPSAPTGGNGNGVGPVAAGAGVITVGAPTGGSNAGGMTTTTTTTTINRYHGTGTNYAGLSGPHDAPVGAPVPVSTGGAATTQGPITGLTGGTDGQTAASLVTVTQAAPTGSPAGVDVTSYGLKPRRTQTSGWDGAFDPEA
jgi:hypothetical protein